MVQSLKKGYQDACDAYLHAFCKQMGISEEDAEWISVGAYAQVADFTVSMQTIIDAIEHGVSFDTFIEWYDYDLICAQFGLRTCNLRSWIKGCPRYSKFDIAHIRKLHNIREQAADNLAIEIAKLKDEK